MDPITPLRLTAPPMPPGWPTHDEMRLAFHLATVALALAKPDPADAQAVAEYIEAQNQAQAAATAVADGFTEMARAAQFRAHWAATPNGITQQITKTRTAV